VDLLGALALDNKMNDDLRDKYVDELNGRLGALFFKILRFHGEDELSVEKEFQTSPEIKPGMGKAAIALARVRFYSKKIAKEIYLDARTMFTFKRAAIDTHVAGQKIPKLVWGPVDRANRNKLMNEIIPFLNKYATDVLPKVASDADRDGAGRDFWVDNVVKKAISIRKERIWGQKVATATYAGMGVVAFFAPGIDIVGAVAGHVNGTIDASANLYTTIWLTTES